MDYIVFLTLRKGENEMTYQKKSRMYYEQPVLSRYHQYRRVNRAIAASVGSSLFQ